MTFLAPPVFADPAKTRTAYAVHWVLVTAVVALSAIVLVQLAVGISLGANARVHFALLAIVLLAFPLVRSGRFRLVGAAVSVGFWLVISAAVALLPTLRPSAHAAYLVIVLIGGFMWTGRSAFWFAAASSLVIAITNLLSAGVAPELAVARPLGSWLEMSGLLFAAALTVRLGVRNLRMASRSAAQNEARYRALFEQTHESVLIIGMDSVVLLANHRAEELLGFEAGELVGTHLRDLVSPQEHSRLESETQRLCREAILPQFAFRAVRRDGAEVFVEGTATLVRAKDGTPLHCQAAMRDVTERKEADANRADLEERLRQAYKMEAVGQLTGGIAHDFNNLLAVVIGNLELARNAAIGGADRLDLMERAYGAAERGAELTRRLLVFSRKQPLQPKVIRLNDLVTEMRDLLLRSIGATISVEHRLREDLWNCFADPVVTENAFLNLILNARDAMPDGGSVTIETDNRVVTQEDTIGVDGAIPGHFVRLTISDTGAGMSREVMAHAFDPFFTTKDQGTGSGLGLSMVYGFARQSGGYVTMCSDPGTGTTVNVYLPSSFSEISDGEEDHAAGQGASGAGQRILVVEDDPELSMFVVRVLKSLQYDAHAAENGEAALQLLGEMDRVDLLLTDVILPGRMTGRDVAQAAVRKIPGLPVLYMSGYSRDVLTHEGRLDPSVELLEKPFKKAVLAERLLALLPRTGPADGS